MNGLGRAAFNFETKSTSWRRAVLPLSGSGDVVQVDITVANVGDGDYQSKVIVDFVEEVSQSLCIYTNVADGVGAPAFTAGHTALLLANDTAFGSPAVVTTYSLWPDSTPGLDNGSGSDVRVNYTPDDWKTFPYVYCEMLTNREVSLFGIEIVKPVQFSCSENAASFATKLFKKITGTTVAATDVSNVRTSRKVGQSIRRLNGGSNTGGIQWSTRRLLSENSMGRALFVNSSGTCFV